MITVNATMSQLIKIGHQGENKAVQVAFDLTPFQAAFQGGYPQLVVRRPCDQSGYPVALIVDGSKAIWIVSASDTEKAGHGQCELQWFVGDALAKSDKYNFLIYSSIPGDAEPPDVPSKTWFEKILSDIGDLSDLDTEAKENLVAAINEARQTGGGGAGGTSDHQKLSNRDAADQHPIAAITGLEAALAGKQPTGNYLTNEALAGAVDDALAQAKASGEFDGVDGKTAYQYAQYGGYTGTEAEFSEKLAAEIPAIDNTLSKAGQAADAAKVGEEIRSLSEEMLTEESDPTVPSWAKAAQKPSYTASEVGADPSGTAASKVAEHNTGSDAHSDIRLLIQGLTDRLNALADSDDTTLDQLSEVVVYIKSNRELISAITTDKVSVADIIDNLTTNIANKPLSAAQGVALKALIDAITVPDKLPNPNALTFTGAVTGSYDGSEAVTVEIPSGGGGSGDIIDVLIDVTIEEAVAAVTVTLDTPRAYKELYIATCVYGDESNSEANAMFLRVNNTGTMGSTNAIAWIPQVENAKNATSKSWGIAFVKLLNDCYFYYCYGSKSANARTPNLSYGEMYTNFNKKTIISTLKFQSINQWTKFGIGSTIKVYGVRS